LYLTNEPPFDSISQHDDITTHIPNDPTNTLNKLFSSAPIHGYSPCNRERKDQFPLREGEKTFPIEGSKYSDMDTFSGPIWPFLLEGFKDSDIYEKKVDGVDCGDKQLSELCSLGGLLAAVMGESYKAINAYTDNGKEVNVDEMRTVLSNFVPEKDPVSLWESTSGFQKILVEYNEPVVNYFTTHPTKQDPTDRQTSLVKELVTDRAYRADSSAKSAFILFPARLMP
jgi:hypothetical protein